MPYKDHSLSELLLHQYAHLEQKYGSGCRILGHLGGLRMINTVLAKYTQQLRPNETLLLETIQGIVYVVARQTPAETA